MSRALESFKAFTERQRVFNDFVRAVAEHKLKAAQAELNQALAAGVYTRVQNLRATLAQLQAEHKKLLRAVRRQKDCDAMFRRT